MTHSKSTLPSWVETFGRAGPWAVLFGVACCLFALFTNPAPDPSMPWLTLPAAWRLPFEQPRVHPWPLSYTVGLWTIMFSIPANLLTGHRLFADATPRGRTVWLVVVPSIVMLLMISYCRFLLPQIEPATWNSPDETFICWMYCSSYVTVWSNITYGVASVGLVSSAAALLDSDWAPKLGFAFGLLALPLALPTLVWSWQELADT